MRFNGILQGHRADRLDAWTDGATETASRGSCTLFERRTEKLTLCDMPSNFGGAAVKPTTSDLPLPPLDPSV